MKEKKLTDKEKAFCDNYVNNPKTMWNQTQSAIAAGYSEHSARNIAKDTYAKDYIKTEIARLIRIKQEPQEELIRRVLEERMKLAFSDIKNYLDEDGKLRDIKDLDTAAIKKVNKTNIKVDGKIVDVQYQVELHDKSRNLDGLASFLGMDRKTVDLNVGDYNEQKKKLEELKEKHKIE
jgi:phage terminase small subunit